MISRPPGAPLGGETDLSAAPAERARRGAVWTGILSVAGIAVVGAHALLGPERLPRRTSSAHLSPLASRTPSPATPQLAINSPNATPPVVLPAVSHSLTPNTAAHFAGTRPTPEPELPTLMMGPLKPERIEVADAGPVRGPHWKLPPLPPLPKGPGGYFADLPAPEPAVPTAIVPRLPPGKAGTPAAPRPDSEPPAAPRAAVKLPPTTPARPLTLRLSLAPSEGSVHGPGEWLKVRASASAPCYLVVLHVDGDRDVSVLFPRRFDLVYQPNVSYSLITRSDPGEHGEVVVAVASVHPLTAADALAAIEAGKGQTPASSRGLLAADLWTAVESALRGRAGGQPEFDGWEPHAWRLAIATHRTPRQEAPEPVDPAQGGGEPPAPAAPPDGP